MNVVKRLATLILAAGLACCPMKIALTPLENGTFLLGCGWCNG